jgi:hypothetical protein
MDVFVGLEFKDGEASIERAGQDIDHGAIGGGEGGYVGVDEAPVEALVDGADAASDQRFETALRTKAEERIAAVALGATALSEARDQRNLATLVSSSVYSAGQSPNVMVSALRKGPSTGAGLARANSSPWSRKMISVGDSMHASDSGAICRMRAIEAAKRARVASASTARARRVTMLPESYQSRGAQVSARSSGS